MRILYGVQGTGNGHTSRARVMSAALANYPDLQVDFLFSGRQRDEYFDMHPFGDFRSYSGLSFATRNGSVDIIETLKSAKIMQFVKDVSQLDLSCYDLVLNDFEPVSAWAAKLQGKRSIGLSHQSAFRYAVPKQGQNLSAKIVMKTFAPCQQHMGVHWHSFGFPILPPIINVAIEPRPVTENKVVVYLPFESLDKVIHILSDFSKYQCYIYHPEVNSDQENGHIRLRKLDRPGFEHDLASASSVIANGGFELPSEALLLGKKLLVKPLVGQFEQESNVATLAQMNLASVMASLDKNRIGEWLTQPMANPINFPNVAESLCHWLSQGATEPLEQLSGRLWRQVRFPDYARLPV